MKGGQSAQHLTNLMNYIAKREGAEQLRDENSKLPATRKQRELIKQLVKDFPQTAEMLEYEDYKTSGTRGDASEFISLALEQNLEQLDKWENYLDYISHRPGVQLWGEHGLFNSEGKVPVLSKAVEEVANHSGNVWTPVVSLRREDAERLGYTNAANWQALINSLLPELAQGYKIHPEHLRWYGAFHNKDKHVHVHLIIFSTDPKEGYLTKQGIRNVKSAFAKRIFRQEMIAVYQKQTEYRNTLGKTAEELMAELIEQMRTGTVDNPRLEQLTADLAEHLQYTKGKKVYGYLPPRVKSMVDAVVDELAKDERVAKAYALWQEMRDEVCRTYSETLPERLPLSAQKEFKPVRNMVIREAMKLNDAAHALDDDAMDDAPAAEEEISDAELADAPPLGNTDTPDGDLHRYEANAEWSDAYRQARIFLYGSDGQPADFEQARELFLREAEGGNALAMCDLARMYADGIGCDPAPETAQRWYAKALSAFLSLENQKPSRYIEYRLGKLYASGLGTEQNYFAAADWFGMAAEQGHKYAQYSLAGLYLRGQGVPQDDAKAFQFYSASANLGFPYAAFELGKLYRDGKGCPQSGSKAEQWFRQAHGGFVSLERQSHDDKLQYRLGWMRLHGIGTEKNEIEAKSWFEKSARLGNPHAQYQLAKLILADPTADSEQIVQAVKWLTKAAEAGQDCAQYALGKLYRDGGAVEKDVPKAVEWLRKSAEQDNAYAAYALGKLYLDNAELPKNVDEALRWLTRSAELGNQYAQYRLGKLFLTGEAVPKDVPKAMEYLTTAADAGNQYAQYTLGKLCLLGQDIPRDKEKAVDYLSRSAAQGNEYAQFFLDRLEQFRDPSVGLAVLRMLRHMSRIFADNAASGSAGNGMQIDRKRMRKLREKKIAAGHKPDDHEEEIQQRIQYR